MTPTIEDLQSPREAVQYIWHPTKPLALAYASVDLTHIIKQVVRQGRRQGDSFCFALPPREGVFRLPARKPIQMGDVAQRIMTFRLEEFSHRKVFGKTFAASFVNEKDAAVWTEAFPNLALDRSAVSAAKEASDDTGQIHA